MALGKYNPPPTMPVILALVLLAALVIGIAITTRVSPEPGVIVSPIGLAKTSGMSHVGILQIESGDRSPMLRNVVKIAGALEVDLGDLL